ncbi:MAG: hypothetical protein ACFFDH_24755 [Promethearchaeota archaeon]
MSDLNQIMNVIKEDFQKSKPSSNKVLNVLLDLRRKAEFQQLSDSEFFNIVGETFKLNPEFFMKKLYRSFRSKIGKLIGDEKLKELERNILEKHYLHEGEQILFEFNGDVGQNRRMTEPLLLTSASIFCTNERFIAQGKLNGPYNRYISDLAFYGYMFPFKNIFKLSKSSKKIKYRMMVDNKPSEVQVKIALRESQEKREELIDEIFEMLSKETSEESLSKPEQNDEIR